MRLYFAGGEVPSHRKILNTEEAPNIAMSFVGLSRRVKFKKPWIVRPHFHKDANIFLDSGGYSVNRDETKYTMEQIEEMFDNYIYLIEDNQDDLALVSEFDALPMGRDWIEGNRHLYVELVGKERFLPIWHADTGLDVLKGLVEEYPNVGVMATDLNGRNLAPTLNNYVHTHGTKFHGVAITSVDDLYAIRWSSVSSTSWISPQQYGDTIIWTGRELKRYPKKMKDQARRKHRTHLNREGFDSEAIENDDTNELLRLSLWSWSRLMDDIERHDSPSEVAQYENVVTTYPETDTSGFTETPEDRVDTRDLEVRKSVSTPAMRDRKTSALPVLGFDITSEESYNADTGENETTEKISYKVRGKSNRQCHTCFLAKKCPAYDPEALCAYDMPLQVRTKEDYANLQNILIDMQTQRVMFGRFAEEIEGGYPDPNLSAEMDRLQKMMKSKAAIEKEGFSVTISAQASGPGTGQAGMLSRMFGTAASEKARGELPGGPYEVEQIVDAEVLGEDQ